MGDMRRRRGEREEDEGEREEEQGGGERRDGTASGGAVAWIQCPWDPVVGQVEAGLVWVLCAFARLPAVVQDF